MIEFLFIAFVFFLGYQLGGIVLSYKLRDIILREARKQGLNVDNSYVVNDKADVYQLFIERVNDVLYLYEREKNTFICQAKTIDELAELANKNNIKYAAVLHDNDVIAFIDGKIKTTV